MEPEQGWAVVVNKIEKQSLGLIAGNTDRSTLLSLDIGKTMLELFVMSRVVLLPNETCDLEDFVFLGDETRKSVEKMAIVLRSEQGSL